MFTGLYAAMPLREIPPPQSQPGVPWVPLYAFPGPASRRGVRASAQAAAQDSIGRHRGGGFWRHWRATQPGKNHRYCDLPQRGIPPYREMQVRARSKAGVAGVGDVVPETDVLTDVHPD